MMIKNFLLTMSLLTSTGVFAAEYYVAQSGDNSSCDTWEKACTTLASAVTKAGAGGDIIYVAQGVYAPTQIVLKDNLSIIGGYNASTGEQAPEEFRTIFSGDNDGSPDLDKVDGVTLDHSKIVGSNNNAQFMRAVNVSGVLLEGFTITGMSSPSHSSGVWHQTSTVTYRNMKFIGNKSTHYGTIIVYGVDAYALATFEDCYFSGNSASRGGAINAHRAGHAVVTRSIFENNTTPATGGAIAVDTYHSSVKVSNSYFENNSAANGGAIYIAGGTGANASSTITNSTFVKNSATNVGGAIRLGSSGNTIMYSTIFDNDAGSGGGGIQNDTGAMNTITASLVLGNTGGGNQNINAVAGQLVDGGYNLIGHSATPSAAFTFGSTSAASMMGMTDVVETVADYNGGIRKSVKIQSTEDVNPTDNNFARNRIPNTGILFYGQGQSEQYPFTSLGQAYGAMNKFQYSAGIHYFKLGASYDVDFNISGGGTSFSTYVDENGWVLIASGDGDTSEVNDGYSPVVALTKASDSILTKAIVTSASFDEIRINSDTNNNGQGKINVTTNDSRVLSDIKAYTRIRNSRDLYLEGSVTALRATTPSIINREVGRPVWLGDFATKLHTAFDSTAAPINDASSSGNSCSDDGQFASTDLNFMIIGHCGDVNGFHWQPARNAYDGPETFDWTAAGNGDNEDLNLWVRSNFEGLCDGAISTDMRGLSRADYVNPADPEQYGVVNDCDIGAFEFNNGYRVDCYEEDGDRYPNTIDVGLAQAGGTIDLDVCYGSGAWTASPKALLDNVGGSFNLYYLSLLLSVLCLRLYRKP